MPNPHCRGHRPSFVHGHKFRTHTPTKAALPSYHLGALSTGCVLSPLICVSRRVIVEEHLGVDVADVLAQRCDLVVVDVYREDDSVVECLAHEDAAIFEFDDDGGVEPNCLLNSRHPQFAAAATMDQPRARSFMNRLRLADCGWRPGPFFTPPDGDNTTART